MRVSGAGIRARHSAVGMFAAPITYSHFPSITEYVAICCSPVGRGHARRTAGRRGNGAKSRETITVFCFFHPTRFSQLSHTQESIGRRQKVGKGRCPFNKGQQVEGVSVEEPLFCAELSDPIFRENVLHSCVTIGHFGSGREEEEEEAL